MRNSTRAAFGAAAAASALTLGIAGCSGDTSSTSTPTSSPPAATQSTTTGAASPSSSGPEVGGPSNIPGPRSSYPAEQSTSTVAGKDCGLSRGPDGALKVTIFEGSNVSCDDIKPIVDKYGPMIATGKDQTIQGWNCSLAQKEGILAECTKGDDSFGFVPR